MQEQSTEVTVPAPAERAALALGSSKTEASLIEMAAKAAAITNVVDVAGRTEAHQAGMTLRNARTTITKTGKAARDDANAFCSAVIAEEKRLVKIVQPEEDRVLALRDAFDAKVAAAKAEADRIEKERKDAIKAKIDAIRNIPMGMADATAFDIAAEREALETFNADDQFAEFITDAQDAIMSAIAKLGDLHTAAAAREQEIERQAALAEANRKTALELERQRAELAAQQQEAARVAAEQEAERQRAAAAALAEQQRVAAETKRQLDEQQAAIAAERAAFEREKQEAAAEQARIAAEKQAVIDAEARRVAEQEEAARVAALPTEQVAEILVDPEPPLFFAVKTITAEEAREMYPAQPTADAVDDLEQVADFRLAVRNLLETRTANEVIAILSDEIERFTSIQDAA